MVKGPQQVKSVANVAEDPRSRYDLLSRLDRGLKPGQQGTTKVAENFVQGLFFSKTDDAPAIVQSQIDIQSSQGDEKVQLRFEGNELAKSTIETGKLDLADKRIAFRSNQKGVSAYGQQQHADLLEVDLGEVTSLNSDQVLLSESAQLA
jgi:hypothetical protein